MILNNFYLSTRFLFQSLDRVQLRTTDGDLIGDTNILDLDTSVFQNHMINTRPMEKNPVI